MSLDIVLLLVGVLGLGIAMWVQVRAFGDNPAVFARKRKRAGVGLAFLLLLLGLVQYVDAGTPGLRLFDAEEDGSWGAVAIDGRPVSSKDYDPHRRTKGASRPRRLQQLGFRGRSR